MNKPKSIFGHLPSAQEKRDAAQVWERKRRERQCAAVDAAVKKNPKMTHADDRKTVATNLGDILDRFEREGKGKKERVLRDANMGTQNDSTKQLYLYTFPRSPVTSPALHRRFSRLIKRTDGYIKLAETAARIAGWDKRDIRIDLFRGSSYDSGASGQVPDLPDYLSELNFILEQLNDWLVRETRVSWYYEMLRKFPVWDDWGNFVCGSPIWPLVDSSSYSPSFFGKAIPGIQLYRVLAAELPVEFASGEKMDLSDSGDEPPAEATIEQLIFRRYFEIRLGIAPVGATKNLRLVFDQRRIDELWNVQQTADPDQGIEAIERWRAYATTSFLPSQFVTPELRRAMVQWSSSDFCGAYDPPAAMVEQLDNSFDELGLFGGWIRFKTLDRDPIPPDVFSEGSIDPGLNKQDALLRAVQDQFIEEIERTTCKKYFDVKIDDGVKCNWNLLSIPLRCPADTIAARVESALHENRLDSLLRQEIEQRCSLLDACLKRRQSLITENEDKLFSRWGPGASETSP